MLDNRYETFLVLCDTLSYTKTAHVLFVTQPTVTQHTKYLENKYQTKLFSYIGKRLSLTEKGKELRKYVCEMKLNAIQIENQMLSGKNRSTLRIGATKTIGEYVIPRILKAYLGKNDDQDADMYVDNTQVLLHMLDSGKIDFALLEGFFDKSSYEYRLLKSEKFIGVCSPDSPLCGRKWKLDELKNERIIVREQGSGTREIIERVLQQYSLELKSFAHESQISNFTAIKELVKNNSGITFLYLPVVEEELKNGSLCVIDIEDFDIKREFNFVMPRKSLMEEKYLDFYRFCL